MTSAALVPTVSTRDAQPLAPSTPAARPAVNPAIAYLAQLAAGSRPAQAAALKRCARLLTGEPTDPTALPWGDLRREHVATIRACLVDDGAAPATTNRYLAALRGVAREAWRSGLMTGEAYDRIRDVRPVKGSTIPAGRDVPQGEIGALFGAAAEGGAGGARDAALLAVLYGAGLRRAEAVGLDLADYDAESGALVVRSGKGRKGRICYATNGSAAALAAWIEVRGTEPGPLLCPVSKGGTVTIRRLSTTAAYLRLQALAERANVAKLSPHDMRRTFVGSMLDAGADIATVQALAGHANVTTTARYDRRGERAKARAAELLHVPFVAARPKASGDESKPKASKAPRKRRARRAAGSETSSTPATSAEVAPAIAGEDLATQAPSKPKRRRRALKVWRCMVGTGKRARPWLVVAGNDREAARMLGTTVRDFRATWKPSDRDIDANVRDRTGEPGVWEGRKPAPFGLDDWRRRTEGRAK